MSDDKPPEPYEVRAQLFEQMAAKIRLNKDSKFGGAFLVIPPGDGEPFSAIFLEQEEQPIFWGAVKSLSEVAMATLDKINRQGFR